MKFEERRGPRGARRTIPDYIPDPAIAFQRALADRDAWRAEMAARHDPHEGPPEPFEPSRLRGDDRPRQRAAFAEALARSVFGRFYWKEPPRGPHRKEPKAGRGPKADR
jgi:hypothetical protein